MQPEFIVNLWAFFDAGCGLVYALAGRVYCIQGTESELHGFLKQLSAADYATAKRYEIPDRFQVSTLDGEVFDKALPLQILQDPSARVFAELLRTLELELPPLPAVEGTEVRMIAQQLPESMASATTIVYEGEDGHSRAIRSREDLEWAREQERSRGREFAGVIA